MSTEPQPDQILGQRLTGIAHSPYSEPQFVLEGIGPARFRTHYLSLANGLVLNLCTAELTIASLPADCMTGETRGHDPSTILGRRIAAVALDDEHSTIVILEGAFILKDDNDGCYGNPLFAGPIRERYTRTEIEKFLDYWRQQPLSL